MALFIVTRTHQYVVETSDSDTAESTVIDREGELIGNERGIHTTTQLEQVNSLHQLDTELADKEPVNGDEERPVKSYF
ncbi:hypothetical protein EZI54_07485 [Marinobacter halodurans]|uniref:Uncharacterized protein n=1 Tax=Marinobacter halodurans TaxID=2528979 RepID=A0ABY1ZME4_9GAMM|nr:hypothetical protein [Marinobacter halodurans]TBW57494.1 hypothetical protein EZI54_07485 [Marinobacter halodurans]